MALKDYSGLIDACSRLGDASRGGDPQLWTVVLEHLTQQEEDVTQQVGSLHQGCLSHGNEQSPTKPMGMIALQK